MVLQHLQRAQEEKVWARKQSAKWKSWWRKMATDCMQTTREKERRSEKASTQFSWNSQAKGRGNIALQLQHSLWTNGVVIKECVRCSKKVQWAFVYWRNINSVSGIAALRMNKRSLQWKQNTWERKTNQQQKRMAASHESVGCAHRLKGKSWGCGLLKM